MPQGASIRRRLNDRDPSLSEIAQGASVGHSNDPSLSGDHPPLDNEDGESTTHNIEGDDTTSNSLNQSGEEEEPTHDARGRPFIHLRGKYLEPSSVVASICTYNFKQIVDPIGFSQKTLTEEYINLYWAEFKKFANCEAYDQDECKKAFVSKCKLRYWDFISYYKKKTKKPSFYTDAQWANYQKGWNLPESIAASGRCSENRRQGLETALGTHCNGCISFAETAAKMAKENNGKLHPFMDFFLKTHKLRNGRNGDSQGNLCSQRAQKIVVEELRAEGIENPDHEAIFLELFGKVKKRKQIYGAGQATSIFFPLATYSSVVLTASMLARSMKWPSNVLKNIVIKCSYKLKRCKPIQIGKLH